MFLATDDYTFQELSFRGFYQELIPLFKENHAETGHENTKYNPDYDRYLKFDKTGFLACFTILHLPTDEFVGVALFFLDSEMQQQDLMTAYQSINFVTKKHRGAAYPFMKFCDDKLKNRGVNVIYRQSTLRSDIGKVYERMGYSLTEKLYLRRL